MISSEHLKHVARGFLMGGADIIPGVSGGTVALILGIYDRLVTAISRFDMVLLLYVRKGYWARAARHVDLSFLASLACGILVGIGGLASVMHYLLEHQLQHTYAVFSGLILASSMLVRRMIGPWKPETGFITLVGAGIAFWLVGLPFFDATPESDFYLFFCGMVAICAMILPGISGAFVLLVLGKYHEITGLLRGVLHGDIRYDTLQAIVVFVAGAAIGLLSFSKILNWLLDTYKALIMSLLCGFMIGSLRKIWPFKHDLTPSIDKFKFKNFENIAPDFSESSVWLSILLAVAAAVVVLALERLSSGRQTS